MASIDVLTPGHGHNSITFDPVDPAGAELARETVESLLREGFLIVVHHNGEDHKVAGFDPKHATYIVKGRQQIPAGEAGATAIQPVSGG